MLIKFIEGFFKKEEKLITDGIQKVAKNTLLKLKSAIELKEKETSNKIASLEKQLEIEKKNAIDVSNSKKQILDSLIAFGLQNIEAFVEKVEQVTEKIG